MVPTGKGGTAMTPTMQDLTVWADTTYVIVRFDDNPLENMRRVYDRLLTESPTPVYDQLVAEKVLRAVAT
jgi:hypothetical protein